MSTSSKNGGQVESDHRTSRPRRISSEQRAQRYSGGCLIIECCPLCASSRQSRWLPSRVKGQSMPGYEYVCCDNCASCHLVDLRNSDLDDYYARVSAYDSASPNDAAASEISHMLGMKGFERVLDQRTRRLLSLFPVQLAKPSFRLFTAAGGARTVGRVRGAYDCCRNNRTFVRVEIGADELLDRFASDLDRQSCCFYLLES